MTSVPSYATQLAADVHGGLASGAHDRWGFQWVDAPSSGVLAHVSGKLRWKGIDLLFMADGLRGVDGRLEAPSLHTLSVSLQQLVLLHFATECQQALAQGPLADLALVSMQWHEEPLPMEGGFEFLVRRPGVHGATRGRLAVPDATGCEQWLDALASLGWPLPAALATVSGQLALGSVSLTADECTQLAVGDLVWIDDAELSPQGLRVHFETAHFTERRSAWIKRSELHIDALVPVQTTPKRAPPQLDGMRAFTVARGAVVERSWLHRAAAVQRLSKPALAMTWTACEHGALQGSQHEPSAFQGRLVVVARRIGLRITRVLEPAACETAAESALPQEA